MYYCPYFVQIYEDTTAAKVVAMTSVGNYMWVCTRDQKLYVVHTSKMKTVACVVLRNTMLEVVQLLHVPEWHMVLVLWELSDIWCLHDKVGVDGLYQIGTLTFNSQNPLNNLCKVTFGNTTEVWATRKDKEIVVLTQSQTGCYEDNILVCSTDQRAAYSCHLITCLGTCNGKHPTYVWVSFEGCTQLVCWDAESKAQLHTVSLHCEGQF